MVAQKGQPYALTPEHCQPVVDEYRRQNRNVSATARALGRGRSPVREALRRAVDFGILGDEELHVPNLPIHKNFTDALARKALAYEHKQQKGRWTRPVKVHVPAGPFILKVFGDPHLDDDACDIELFVREWRNLDEQAGVWGLCVGDWFNNWRQSLAHLWKEQGDPTDAWTIFVQMMYERGSAVVGACSGNHDDWTAAPYDPVQFIMEQHGVKYRRGAIMLHIGAEDFVSVALRHKWRGNSMYSAAHGMIRACREGVQADLLIGGHTHQTETRHYVHQHAAMEGEISQLLQIEAFKRFDDFADVHGFMGPSISPVCNYVCQPHLPRTNPDRLSIAWDHDEAVDRLRIARARG